MIVYTCIAGNYDIERPPQNLPDGWVWECLRFDNYNQPKALARFAKCCPKGESIWIDANLEFTGTT
jgi:hypothetical protein